MAKKPKAAASAAASIDLPPLASMGEIREVPIAALYVAPENARHGAPAEDLPEIAATLARYGLLQALVAYEGEPHEEGGQSYAVTNGRRRLAGMQAIHAEDAAQFATVQVRVVPREYAREIALAGETHVELSPAQEARAWVSMQMDGASPEKIAKAFGVTEHKVLQRLKLGQLYEPILQALDAGTISLEVAQAYASALMARQESTWKKLGAGAASWQVRRALGEKVILAKEPLAKFVTEALYRSEGGRVEQELFTTLDESRWLDVELARGIADRNLKRTADDVAIAEPGWKFIEVRATVYDADTHSDELVDGNLGAEVKPSPEQKKARTALEQRLAQIAKRQDQIEKEQARIPHTDESDAYAKLDDENDALTEEAANLETERDAMERALRVYDEAARAKGGVLISISPTGAIVITRGLVRAKDRPKAAAKKTPPAKGKAAAASPEAAEPAADMSNAAHERTTRLASRIIADALQRKPEAALIVLAGQLARIVIYNRLDDADDEKSGRELVLLQRRHQSADRDLPALACDKETARDAALWRTALRKAWSKLEETLATWDERELLKLIAYCTGQLFTVMETQPSDDAITYKRAAAIGRLAGADPGAVFTPQLEYLKGLSTPALHAAARELGLEVSANASKATLAAAIADAAAPQAWTPPLLRELTGAAWTPGAKANGKAKPASTPTAKAKPKPAAKKARPARALPRKVAAKSKAKKTKRAGGNA